MELNEYYKEAYLTCGNIRDDYVFTGCSLDFVNEAKRYLALDGENVKSCCVTFSRDDVDLVEKTLGECSDVLHKKILVRDYVTAKIMKEIFLKSPNSLSEVQTIDEQLDAFYKNDLSRAKDYHIHSYMPHDVAKQINNIGKFELNLFLLDVNSVVVQSSINNFISNRNPYKLRVFTTNETLSTYYDQSGNIIESPHDYMEIKSSKFLESVEESEM